MTDDVEELIRYVGQFLLDYPEAMTVEVVAENGTRIYRLEVHEDDRGKIIGQGGRTAQALRSVVRASGALRDTRCQFEIVD